LQLFAVILLNPARSAKLGMEVPSGKSGAYADIFGNSADVIFLSK